ACPRAQRRLPVGAALSLPAATRVPLAARPEAAPGDSLGPGARHATHPGLRILTIAPTPFFGDYGCHVRILEELRALQAIGHRGLPCTAPSGRAVDGLRVQRAPRPPGRWHARPGSSRHKLYLDCLLGLSALRAAAAFRPALVHGHLHEGAFIGYPLARAARVPL